jgi:hypothetical protein
MRTIESTTVIDAPLTDVWEVLSDGHQYGEWNPFITSVSGAFQRGARPTLRIAPPGKRAMTFRPRITDASPDRGLRWEGHLVLPGLCDAEHEFVLTPESPGRTRVTQRETFRGVLVPVLGGMLEPTRQGFDAMHEALRHRVRSRAQTTIVDPRSS